MKSNPITTIKATKKPTQNHSHMSSPKMPLAKRLTFGTKLIAEQRKKEKLDSDL